MPTNITNGTEVLANGLLIPAGEKYYYELEILLVNSKTVDQTADLNASFWTQFTLESGTPAANEVLASLGLEDSVKVEPSTYNMFSFTTLGYNNSTSYAGQSACVYNGHVAMSMTGEVTSETCSILYYVMMYGSTFYVDSSFETLNIGKSNWDSSTNACLIDGNQVMHMMTSSLATEEQCGQDVYMIGNGYYLTGAQKLGKGSMVEISTNEGLYAMEDDFGTSYYFRGTKSLNNIVKFGTYDMDMYYYPYAKSDGTNPYTTGSLEQCQSETTSSSYCTSSNKYASAGDSMYWRIVRINGDGTLRLMYIGTSANATGLTSTAGSSNFNTNFDNPKYTGYTYDNSSPNVQDGTPSDMKNYLDTWFERSLSDESANIATSQFYSDTTDYAKNESLSNAYGEEIYTYAPTNRLGNPPFGTAETITPTLKTRETTESYGGEYYLKVGLLNADELVLSGYDGAFGSSSYSEAGTLYPYTTNTSYLLWSLSPIFFDGSDAFVLYVNISGSLNDYYVSYTGGGVAPVINLKPEVATSLIGTGIMGNEYRLS